MILTVLSRCPTIGSKTISCLLLVAAGCSDSAADDAAPTGSAAGASGNTGSAGSSMAGASGGAVTGGGGSAGGDDSAACAAATFCDGFESAAPGMAPAAPWTVSQTNATVSVDTTRAFRGTQSVKTTTLPTTGGAPTYKRGFIGLAGAPVIPLPEQRVYGRMMFYLDSAPSTNVHWTFVDGTGLVAGQDYSATYRYGGQLPVTENGTFRGNQLMANYDTTDYYATPSRGPQTDCYRHANGVVVPVGRWACAEWFFDGTNNQMRFWLDGMELTDIQINQTGTGCVAQPAEYVWQAPVFSRIDVGWESYQADEARSIWIDDVVISPQQVGCPAQ
jgi:hypothetical protein